MFNINNKNLISFVFGLLIIILSVVSMPKNADAVVQLNCQISNFNISSSYVTVGGSSILTWNTNNCNSINISNVGSVNSSGSLVVYPSSTTTYLLTAYGSNGNPVTIGKTIRVQELHCQIPNFNVSSSYITSGDFSTLNWNTNNCSGTSISNIGSVNTSGTQNVSPTVTTTYILTAYDSDGTSITKSKTITVQELRCEISNFNVSSNYIKSGESSELNWDTNNCNSITISNIGSVGINGIKTVYPKSTTTYLLTAYGSNGNPVTRAKTIKVEKVVAATIIKNTNKNTTNNTTSKTTSTNNNTTNNNNSGSSSTTDREDENNTSQIASNALFGSSGFLPSSLFGWLFFAILILIAIVLWRKLYTSDKGKEAPLKHA